MPEKGALKKLDLPENHLKAKATSYGQEALRLHMKYRGKMQTVPRCPVRDLDDFAVWYTPGVAEVCKAIVQDKDRVYDYTNKWNTIAVVTDGTRVLGLGDIGPEAAMPVMEGKALIFKYLGGVDAVPICLNTKDPEEFVRTVKLLEPSFGGINLEDIAQPKCFGILRRLRSEMQIPVWHDDQQGTAAVTLAGLLNALKLVNKKLDQVKISMIGAGAANICTAQMLMAAGAVPGNIYMVDTGGILHPGRNELKEKFPEKWEMCLRTNSEGRVGGIRESMVGADVVIALSRPGPGVIEPEWIKLMADDPIVFACANPVPEIWPWDAKAAGVKVIATGRSDFPNQVNNSLGFPAIFRGALDVRAKTISDEMCVAAALTLADYVERNGSLDEDHILPTMEEWEVFPLEAAAVGAKAVEQGLSRVLATREQLEQKAYEIIQESREVVRFLMEKGVIAP